MSANRDRGELDIFIGDQTRTLRFRTQECMVLEDRLGADPLAFIGRGGGQTKFIADAIFAGLSYQKDLKLTPGRVAHWLDEAEIDRESLQKEILYAIGRGRPGEDGKKMVAVLDEVFGTQGAQAEGKEPSPAG